MIRMVPGGAPVVLIGLLTAFCAGAGAAAAQPVPRAATSSPLGGPQLGSASVVLGVGAPVLPPKLTASSWLVADAGTGSVLATRNPHGRFAPASTLKILTAVTLLPRLDPRRIVVVTNADETVDGTKVGLVPGLRIRIDQLFTALLVVSANDAANVLARAGGGSAVTVRLMTERARELQALDTLPRSVHGLDAAGQSSSAYDLALLGRAGLAMPAFRRYVATRRSVMPAPGGKVFQISTHNRLLGSYPGTIGIKNGHTDAAGSSLVAAARRGNRTLLVTLMHADAGMWQQAAALLDWGFQADGRTPSVGTLILPPAPIPGRVTTNPPARPAATSTVEPARNGRTTVGAVALGGSAGLLLITAALLRRRRRA